jgi:hypothetical protein
MELGLEDLKRRVLKIVLNLDSRLGADEREFTCRSAQLAPTQPLLPVPAILTQSATDTVVAREFDFWFMAT